MPELFEGAPEIHEGGEGARILHELERAGEWVFHGSPSSDITELEIRQPYDYTGGIKQEHGSPCVAATRSADVAIFRALVNDDYTGFEPNDQGNIRLRASQKALDSARTRKGFVYVLSKEDFAQFGAHPTMEWRSSTNQKPAQIVEVTASDLPKNIDLIEMEHVDMEYVELNYAKFLLERLLKQPHAKAYFGIDETEVADLRRVINGRSPNSPESTTRYQDLIRRLMELPMQEPHIIIPDTEHEGWDYLLLKDGKERRAALHDGKYFLLSEIHISPEELVNVQSRITAFAATGYFPEFKIVEDSGSTYLGVEFVEGNYPERGIDVHEFLEACKRINFGPDTNHTNFKQTDGGVLKYVDADAGEWIINPSKHPYVEGAYAVRDKIW